MTSRASIATALLLIVTIGGAVSAEEDGLPAVAFDQDGPVTTSEGHTTLSWATDETEPTPHRFELQDSDREDFAGADTWYRGPDRASFISGLPEGTTWFRVRVVDGDRTGRWSEPIAIEVHYASRSLLVRLLTLGAIVFLATVTTVVVGHRLRNVPVR